MNSVSNKKQKHLAELQAKKTVEHNDLITSVAKMDKIPLKIFELAVAHIDVENPPENHTIYLSKNSLFAFFNVNDNDKNRRFKEAIEIMQKQAYFVIKKEESKGVYFENIVPIPFVRWNDYNDKVTIRFDQAIMPYLIDLQTNFTQYAITDIMDLNSKYSVILYKWLSMNYNQYERYKDTVKRTRKQLDSYENPTITIKDLRRMTDTEEELKRFYDFEKRVLKTAYEEINKYTHFNITYEKIRYGRSIEGIQFFIQKKKVADNVFYKDEQQDEAYLEDKASKEQKRTNDFVKVQQSPYTQMLLTNRLLDFTDILNIDLMLNLGHAVYKLYDKLVELTSIEQLNVHLAYVHDKKNDYTKENKVKYLHKSIESYLTRY